MGNIKKIKNLNVEATSGKVAFSLFKLLYFFPVFHGM